MQRDEMIKNITYIKEVIESSNRYTNLSGLAGMLSGAFALIGCGLTYYLIGSINLIAALPKLEENILIIGIIWLGVFIAAVLSQIVLTVRKSKRLEILPWTKLSRQVIFALIPSLLAGAVLGVYLIKANQLIFIPAVWILLYGVGVAASGMFSTVAVRFLGWLFVLTSAIPLLLYPEYGLIFMALTFGIYHIIYGIVLYIKYKG